MYSKSITAVLAAALLPACAPIEGLFNSPSPGAQPARCQAAGGQSLLGQTVEPRVVSEAIVATGALRSRIIRPGEMVTLDVDPLRLNLEVDEGGRIRRLRCG